MKKYLLIASLALTSCAREIIKQRVTKLAEDKWEVSTYAWYKLGIVWVHHSWEDHSEGDGTIPRDSIQVVKTRDSLTAASKLETVKWLER
jgi:hypothetical protein